MSETETLNELLREHQPSGWACSCGWPLNDSVGSWVDHLSEQLRPFLRCMATDPDGSRCRLYARHDGQHGDGLGTVWDAEKMPASTPTPAPDDAEGRG